MKLIHISDLHLGKRLNDFSLIEDQAHILDCILDSARTEKPDAVLIAGDVYDKSVPSGEAVTLLDNFLVGLSGLTPHIFLVSGNHDSPERLAFGSRLLSGAGLHVSPVFSGEVECVRLLDGFGPVDIYLLPFIKPANVRRFHPEIELISFTDAVAAALTDLPRDSSARNVLVCHQFVTGAATCASEEISVGGADNTDVRVFDGFDYVALGHLHGAQSVSRPTIRYSGTPLKYSFSEASHEKSMTVVELSEKGSVSIRTIPLTPLHDMKRIKGSFAELTAKEFYTSVRTDDYFEITLTDEDDIPNALALLRHIYPNIMQLYYDNTRTRSIAALPDSGGRRRTPEEVFSDFFENQYGRPMTAEQQELISSLLSKIAEEKI